MKLKILFGVLLLCCITPSFAARDYTTISQGILERKLEHPYLVFDNQSKQEMLDRIAANPTEAQIFDLLQQQGRRLLLTTVEPEPFLDNDANVYNETFDFEHFVGYYREGAKLLAFLYQMTGDEAYAQKAFHYADRLCEMTYWVLGLHRYKVIHKRVWPWGAGDDQVVEKIVAAQAHHKKIDGHAPDLVGNDLNAYVAAGVYSDHECHDLNDAIAKLQRGQFIMIREGTAARNLEALVPLLCDKYVERCMFCTDDKHPNDLLEKGHIDYIVKKAISLGADPITAIKAACHNAARYFLLNNRGAIAPGYLADFVIIDDFEHFNIEKVYKRGVLMVDHGVVADFPVPEIDPYLVNRAHDTFHVAPLTAADFTDSRPHAVIGMVNGEITTTDGGYTDRIDVDYDILKIAVIERHKNTHHIGLGYIKGYGLQKGAVATSISHDSHNIIVVGTNEEDMAFAANRIVQQHGGITVVENGQVKGELLLAIAGIMSDDTLINVNRDLENAKKAAYDLGVSTGIDPFMTLSFMALPVIPSLRITTRGVFDVTTQRYV